MNTFEDMIRSTRDACLIIAHRGAWHDAPENSLPAISNAADAGYAIVEIDIQRSSDGTLFVFHDMDLNRMAGAGGLARDWTIDELKALRLRHRNGGVDASLTDQRIPTLSESLEEARDRVYLDLDVKFPELLGPVAQFVRSMGLQNQTDIKGKLRSVADLETLTALRDLYGLLVMPQVRFAADTAVDQFRLVKELGAPIVETKFDSLETLERVGDLAREAGITLWVNTLDPVACCGLNDSLALSDPEGIWGRLRDAGVGAIQTDEPEVLARFLARVNA